MTTFLKISSIIIFYLSDTAFDYQSDVFNNFNGENESDRKIILYKFIFFLKFYKNILFFRDKK